MINMNENEDVSNIPVEEELHEDMAEQSVTEVTSPTPDPFNDIEQEILAEAEKKSRKKKKRSQRKGTGNLLLSFFMGAIFTFAAATAVYCIYSDIKASPERLSQMSQVNLQKDFTLNTNHRPTGDIQTRDENGRYTVEGLAQLVRPQVVDIYTFAKKEDPKPSAGGSGIIISNDGYIVTNTHILDGMQKYVVNTYNGSSFEAELIGRDAKTDISVIKIKAGSLTPAELGNSDEVVQGEAVVAIGNPAGLTGSITDGIVSGLNRKIKTEETGFEMNCIQTDAAISPGNSGGALVNMYGQVIGITSSKYATTTSEGLGFAITINEAKPIIEELISKGYVSGRVRIGITFYTNYANYAAMKFKDKFGFDIPDELKSALWIEKIAEECDISNTELKPDDFIVQVEGKQVGSYSELTAAIKGKKGGDTVTAKCARVDKDGKVSYFDIEFKLMEDTSGNF